MNLSQAASNLVRKPASEIRLARAAAAELKATHKLSSGSRNALEGAFGKRLDKAFEVVKNKQVKLYAFKPSERTVWAVQGKSGEYQVMSEIPFCYCNDYYYRVMGQKKGLCYHLIAQMLGEASNKFARINKHDKDYLQITDKCRRHTKP